MDAEAVPSDEVVRNVEPLLGLDIDETVGRNFDLVRLIIEILPNIILVIRVTDAYIVGRRAKAFWFEGVDETDFLGKEVDLIRQQHGSSRSNRQRISPEVFFVARHFRIASDLFFQTDWVVQCLTPYPRILETRLLDRLLK